MGLIKKYRYEFIILAVMAGISAIAIFFGDRFGIFADRQRLEDYINELGILGPLAIIGVSFLDVLIAPIPGGISPAVSGILYGKFFGTIYVLVGNIIGANVTFWIARRWGERFFLLFVKKEKIDEFQDMVANRQKFIWTAFFIPILPYDVLNIAIGLSDIPWKKFFIRNTLGMAVSMTLLVIFGSTIAELIFR
jgi:uncharacterized membrane protein YdjX (TVP38/TMEM64 family)